MDLVAWIFSALLAAVMLGAGVAKLATPYAKLAGNSRMAWVADFSPRAVQAIGALEVLGALGLILPWLLGIVPVLTPLAAVGVALLMVGALVTHGRRGELRQAAPVNVALLLLAVAVAVLRSAQL